MNKKKQRFCELMATGMYDGALSVEMVWGLIYDDPASKAEYLLAKKNVSKRVAQLKSSNEALSLVTRTWISNKLVTLIETADNKVDGVYDPNTIRYSLDMLNKLNGYYEKDNIQKADVSLTMHY